jgi:hypothetical protein
MKTCLGVQFILADKFTGRHVEAKDANPFIYNIILLLQVCSGENISILHLEVSGLNFGRGTEHHH